MTGRSAADGVTVTILDGPRQVLDALGPHDLPPGPIELAMTCGRAWDQHIDAVRLRSYELAVARGRLIRWPA